ncbi:hypothetical protein NQ314_015143 [Rhamnusium bicolor]|uniref:Uncharacterized protein n=1 Tax=Rhamnusium bicolor TaxID=1586634 RepID=A0AAV8WZE6_9CUCU|nr:hypothetical protein NQ314_015143 [Rhamnusium bicolor]
MYTKSKPKKNLAAVQNDSSANVRSEDHDLDTSGFASETTEQEVSFGTVLFLFQHIFSFN